MDLKEANLYLKQKGPAADHSMDGRFHFTPPLGWLNDPNGFCFYQGEYHLFYQYHLKNGIKECWGHAKSKDLIKFEHLPIAIVPDRPYDKDGCWSGTAIEKDGLLYLFYTGHVDNGDGTHSENQCLAISKDGINFEKNPANPVVPNTLLPNGISRSDFRDPYVYFDSGRYHMLCGTNQDGVSTLVKFSSDDLFHWLFSSVPLRLPGYGKQLECPSYIPETGLLFFSAMDVRPRDGRFLNVSSSLYALVKEDPTTGTMQLCGEPDEIDHGMEFYAPQVIRHGNRTIMASWNMMWGRSFPYLEKNGIDSCLTMFRTLELKDNKLVQRPLPEYDSLFEKAPLQDMKLSASGSVMDDEFRIGLIEIKSIGKGDFCMELFPDSSDSVSISYMDDFLYFDRSRGSFQYQGNPIDAGINGIRSLRIKRLWSLSIFVDTTSIEIYANEGEAVMTDLVHASLSSRGFAIRSLSGISFSLAKRRFAD